MSNWPKSFKENLEYISRSIEQSKKNASDIHQQICELKNTIDSLKNQNEDPEELPVKTEDNEGISTSSSSNQIEDDSVIDNMNSEMQSEHQNFNCVDMMIRIIQRESSVVSKLKEENLFLKIQLEDFRLVLELIMSKYRKRVSELLEISTKSHQNVMQKHEDPTRLMIQAEIIRLSTLMERIIEIFKEKIATHNEKILYEQLELLHQVKFEYQGLQELYKISKEFGSLPVEPKSLEKKETAESDAEDSEQDFGTILRNKKHQN